MTNTKSMMEMSNEVIGKYCIVRGDRSGLFAGTVKERNGREVLLEKARRLWYWDGAASDFQIAAEGVKRPEKCKFTVRVDSILILDAIEIIPAQNDAIAVIEGVPEWKM